MSCPAQISLHVNEDLITVVLIHCFFHLDAHAFSWTDPSVFTALFMSGIEAARKPISYFVYQCEGRVHYCAQSTPCPTTVPLLITICSGPPIDLQRFLINHGLDFIFCC